MDRSPAYKLQQAAAKFKKQQTSRAVFEYTTKRFNQPSHPPTEIIAETTRVSVGGRTGVVLDVDDDELTVELDDRQIPEVLTCNRSSVLSTITVTDRLIDAFVRQFFLMRRIILCRVKSCYPRRDSDDPNRIYFSGFADKIVDIDPFVDEFMKTQKLFYESPSRVELTPAGTLSTVRNYDETLVPHDTILLAQVQCSLRTTSYGTSYRVFCHRWAIVPQQLQRQYLIALDYHMKRITDVPPQLKKTWTELTPSEKKTYGSLFVTPTA
jgi:hypothetical protein